MCGIAGYMGTGTVDEGRIKTTLGLMRHRGPDGKAFWVSSSPAQTIFLLHARLKIIDLDARADQPFTIDDCTVVFNGEIYNYVELRQKLESDGVVFRTTSDTEVLVQAYLRWGVDCLKWFEGMWSFVLYDARLNRVMISRDRFGEKPLYIHRANDGLYFGSEIKFLRGLLGQRFSVNRRHVQRYLVNGYKALYKTTETFFDKIEELPRASVMTIDAQGRETLSTYWQPTMSERPMTQAQAIEEFRSSLITSVGLRLRADVPLAFCLSGGVDSAALVSIAAKKFGYDVATFSLVDSDERYNEEKNIMATVNDLHCRHTIIRVTTDNTLDRLRKLVEYHDSPVSTISYYIHSFLSEAIAAHGYRVVCSGSGADELVTGYYDHYLMHLYELRDHKNFEQYLTAWKRHVAPVVRNPFLQNPRAFFENPQQRDHIYLDQEEFAACLRQPFDEPFSEKNLHPSLLRNRMLNELFEESIPVILHEDDLNSMMHSIENRSPYLDTKLFECAYAIPAEHLIVDGYNKFILREAVKGILNETVRTDRQKKGFNASIHSIIDIDEKSARDYLLEQSPIFDMVDRSKFEMILNQPRPFTNSYSKFLFSFLNAKMFLESHG